MLIENTRKKTSTTKWVLNNASLYSNKFWDCPDPINGYLNCIFTHIYVYFINQLILIRVHVTCLIYKYVSPNAKWKSEILNIFLVVGTTLKDTKMYGMYTCQNYRIYSNCHRAVFLSEMKKSKLNTYNFKELFLTVKYVM